MSRGWDEDGTIELQSRVDTPAAGAVVPAGAVRIGGTAWAGAPGVAGVEVRIDDGPWTAAALGVVGAPHTWVQWLLVWDGAGPGDHVVAVRATDSAGRAQVEQPSTPEPSGATGYHYRSFSVA